jgi:CBS domain containing-hemolysin-like protein
MLMIFLPIAIAMLLVISAILAASETALFSLTRMEHTLEQLNGAVRAAIERLMARPLESIMVIIGLNEAANVFAECLATTFLILWLGKLGAYLSVPLMLVTVLIFCDITPKTLSLAFPTLVIQISARPLAVLASIAHPVAKWFTPAQPPPRPEPVSEEEFKALLKASEFQGEVEPQERELIHRVFDFDSRRAGEVMTAREKMFMIDVATPPDRVIAEVVAGHFSRIPIYRGNPDNIIGVLHVKDLVIRGLETALPRLERLVRPGYFIPPSRPLGELFDEMRRGRFQLAIVVNEYGRVLGVITLEDLLEELFGEIRDEFDYDGPEVLAVSDNEWLVSGAIELERLKRALANSQTPDTTEPLGADGKHTLGTLVLRRLGRVPRPGEKVRLGNFEAAVERVRGATVELVRLVRCT